MSTAASFPTSAPPPTQEFSPAAIEAAPLEAVAPLPEGKPPRPAWVEIDLSRLRRNFALIHSEKPSRLQILSVVKDDGYGHGAFPIASAALASGATCLALSTVEEAVKLREQGVSVPMLLLGDRQESELPWCLEYALTCCVSEPHTVEMLARLAEEGRRRLPVHLKVNTGMNRYGVRWDEAPALAAKIAANPSLLLEGVLSHFAQSDEADKTFARCQLARFKQAIDAIEALGIQPGFRHLCNSGGFLDLPEAWFDMVRLGILPLGVFPSSVCRRIPGVEPVMSVKARVAAIQKLQPGDTVGYGMRFTADVPRRIAVLPIGYGDGFPRVRNQGCALIRGRRAPLVGGVAMDAVTIDVTDIPETQLWDEAVLMGRQGEEEISVHEMARLRNSVSYDVLTSWRGRLPRIYVG